MRRQLVGNYTGGFPATSAYRRGEVAAPWFIAQAMHNDKGVLAGHTPTERMHERCCHLPPTGHDTYNIWVMTELEVGAHKYLSQHHRGPTLSGRRICMEATQTEAEAMVIFNRLVSQYLYPPDTTDA